ncbi:MAG: electron transport complex subunit E [Gammaproteobacteria bacterium]
MSKNNHPGFAQGLWHANPALVQLLGLCPLLAVTTSLVNGIGLGLATLFVLCATNVLVSASRAWIHRDLRLPAYVLIIAAFVTAVDLAFRAWLFDLHESLGLFIPLIVTNCIILGRAEAFASRQPVWPSLLDAVSQGLGFAAVLISLGAVRELLGRGSLFSGAEMLFGPAAASLQINLLSDEQGLLLAILPPGAFIGLAVLIALRNRYLQGTAARKKTEQLS